MISANTASENLRGSAFMLLAMASFAIGDSILKYIGQELPLSQILVIRGCFATLILFTIAKLTGRLRPLSLVFTSAFILRLLGEVVASFFFLTALLHMPIANASAIMQVLPLTVTLGAAFFFGEQIGWRRLAAILAGLLGVMLIIQPGLEGFNIYSVYCLVAVCGTTLRDLATRKLTHNVPTLFVSLITVVVITLFGAALGTQESWVAVSAREIIWLGGASIFLISGFIGIVSAMRVGEVGVVTPFRYSVLLFAIVIGIFIFDEIPNSLTIIGSTIVVCSGIYAILPGTPAREEGWMKAMFLNRKTPPHLLTLVLAAALGPLAMNVFLPSLPGITDYFQTNTSTAQLSVSLYLATVAVMQLVFGPMSDKFGRRPVILVAFILMIMGTLICIFATSIEWFLLGRMVQACAAAGLVLSRAIARDLSSGASAASMIAYITMGMSLAPMIGPVIGGFLDELYGWQSSFLLTLAFGILATAMVYFDLGETNQHKQGSFIEQFASYPELLQSRRFWGYSFTSMLASGAFFAFLGGGSLVANRVYGLSPAQYGFYFMFISMGYLIGNFISGRLSTKVGINRMMLGGNIVAAVGLSAAILIIFSGVDHPFAFFGFIFFVGLGNGMTLPNAMAGVVNVRPNLAGSASGLAGSMQLGGGALLSVLAAYAINTESDAIGLTAMMLGSVVCAGVATLYVMSVEMSLGEEKLDN